MPGSRDANPTRQTVFPPVLAPPFVSPHMPTVRYSHQLSDSSFVGIVASSMELSIGYEDNHQRGPYASTGLRFPRYDSSVGGFTPLSAFSGGGTVDFHTRNTVVGQGGSATAGVLGAYVAGDFQIVSGSLRLTSSAIDSTSAVGNLSIPTAPVQLTAIKFKELSGFLFGLETGLIVKISERVGLKAGAYYQLAYIDYGTPKGVYLNAGRWTKIGSAAELTSADKRRDMGFWGLNFGVFSRPQSTPSTLPGFAGGCRVDAGTPAHCGLTSGSTSGLIETAREPVDFFGMHFLVVILLVCF